MAACLSALVVGCGSNPAPTPATDFPPISWMPGQTVVSIEFDDGIADQYGVRSILAHHKMKATFFVNSGNLINSYHMTWSQVHQLYAEGNEIAGHTVLHQHLSTLSTEEAKREICDDRRTLLAQGFPVTDFAYPYGDYTGTTRSLVQECGYDSGRWILGVFSPSCRRASCPFAESIPPTDSYLTRTPQNVLDTDSLANIEGYVTQAQQHGGGWVQLVFHHICNRCELYATSKSIFSELLNWLATQKNTTTDTVQQVMGGPLQPGVSGPAPVNLSGQNLLRNPSLEEEGLYNHGVPAGWETISYGANIATFARVNDAHSGSYAERLEVTSLKSGAARLLSDFDLGQYAPTPEAGKTYEVGAYYKSTVPVLFYLFTRDHTGEWKFWTSSAAMRASPGWRKAKFTTPKIPNGVRGISVGLGIQQVGSVTMDDFSLSAGA
jgi:peptidoglycan/xylan/chitin deacetylase (PgdA/CDA1 family)